MSIVSRFFGFLAGRLGNEYESDITRYMKDYLRQHPEEVESQRRGRAIWWDKTLDERAPAPSMRHAPRAGGNEATFEPAGGYEWSFEVDDNTNQALKNKP